MPANRKDRVARELQREISQILLFGLKDPRIGFLTVTRVAVSSDLKCAKVYLSVLGTEVNKKTAMHGLRHARRFVQLELSHSMRMKFVPEISFYFDEDLEKTLHLNSLLDSISKESKAQNGSEAEKPPDGAVTADDSPIEDSDDEK